MNIKSNSVVSSDGLNAVNFPNSISVGSSLVSVFGDIQTGVLTVTTLNTNSTTATTVNATSFVGDGSQLSGIQTTTVSRVIALKYIFADPPLRA